VQIELDRQAEKPAMQPGKQQKSKEGDPPMVIWDDRRIIKALRSIGFSLKESIRLIKWRNRYVRNEMDFSPSEYRRMEFAKWLVAHGKLTERMV
jgi:hypothetical protein